jgi:CBS domain-containing protein
MTRRVDQIMSREPVVIHVDHSLAEAAQRMKEYDIGSLPAVDGDELVGVVTDRDLVVRGIARGADPASTSVLDAMTRHVVFCHDKASTDEAASLMAQQRVRRLMVVDDERGLVGVISLGDMARAGHGDKNIAAAATRVISLPLKTAKIPGDEDPTGGRARGSPAGTLHVYAQQPRVRRPTP